MSETRCFLSPAPAEDGERALPEPPIQLCDSKDALAGCSLPLPLISMCQTSWQLLLCPQRNRTDRTSKYEKGGYEIGFTGYDQLVPHGWLNPEDAENLAAAQPRELVGQQFRSSPEGQQDFRRVTGLQSAMEDTGG